MIRANYIRNAFSREYVELVLDYYERFCREVSHDAIVVRGVSGLLLSGLISHHFRKGVVVVRKIADSHSYSKLEGTWNCSRLVFFDDFVANGDTANEVHRALLGHYSSGWTWAGMFLWSAANEKHDRADAIRRVPVYRIWGDVSEESGEIVDGYYRTNDPILGYREWRLNDVAGTQGWEAPQGDAALCRV